MRCTFKFGASQVPFTNFYSQHCSLLRKDGKGKHLAVVLVCSLSSPTSREETNNNPALYFQLKTVLQESCSPTTELTELWPSCATIRGPHQKPLRSQCKTSRVRWGRPNWEPSPCSHLTNLFLGCEKGGGWITWCLKRLPWSSVASRKCTRSGVDASTTEGWSKVKCWLKPMWHWIIFTA